MSDLTPYEEELAKRSENMPLPDQSAAWEKLKKLLDDDDDDGVIIPPPPGNGLWYLLGFLFIGIAVSLCIFLHSSKKTDSGDSNTSTSNNNTIHQKLESNKAEQNKSTTINPIVNNDEKSEKKNVVTGNKSNIEIDKLPNNSNAVPNINRRKIVSFSKKKMNINIQSAKVSIKNNKAINKKSGFITKTRKNYLKSSENTDLSVNNSLYSKNKLSYKTKAKVKGKFSGPGIKDNDDGLTETMNDTIQNITSVITDQNTPSIGSKSKTDTSFVINTTTEIKAAKDSSVKTEAKKTTSTKERSFWTAGFAVQQSFRLECNCVYPEDKSTDVNISDYLPSIYVRFHPSTKLFMQAELNYGAPNYIRQFMYQSTIQDQPYNFIASTHVLKKIYYHQLYASVHRFIIKNWSVGIGAGYNIFSSQISQADVNKKIYGSADSIINSANIKIKNDSNFTNYSTVFLESQYQWKHFSAGFRFIAGLQSYIQYIDPFSGEQTQKRKNSLNIFLRYELWRQRKN